MLKITNTNPGVVEHLSSRSRNGNLPGGVQLLAAKRHGSIFVEIAARTDAGNQRAQVVRSDSAIDDLALADMRFSGARAQDRRDLCVKVDVYALARSCHKGRVPRHRPYAARGGA